MPETKVPTRPDAYYLEIANAQVAALTTQVSDLSLMLIALNEQLNLALPSKTKFTPEGGLAVRMTNRTGAASIKGTVLSTSDIYDTAVKLQSEEFDAVGIMYESGIADGAECWVVVSGVAEVLLKDGTAATRGYWAKCADTDGRAEVTTPPSGLGTVSLSEHFKEVGHCTETKAAGTNVLAKLIIHQN